MADTTTSHDASPLSTAGLPSYRGISEVTAIETHSGRILLVLSLCTARHTELVEISSSTGRLLPRRQDWRFDSHRDALEYVRGSYDGVKISENGHAILGYLVLAGFCLVLVARKTRVSASLPGGHLVRTVTDAVWMRVPLEGHDRQAVSKDEAKNLQAVTEFALEGVHFFCETLDVTKPFCASRPTTEFVWNAWLRKGVEDFCPKMLQGLAESRVMTDAMGTPFNVALFCRRSRLHPGTRYLARGINKGASCGNEIECEQLVWCRSKQDGVGGVAFASHVWRRGSVPIWWGVDIKNTVGEAEIWVKPDDAYNETARYFRRLTRQYGVPPSTPPNGRGEAEEGGSGEISGRPFESICINLLRCAPGKSELKLSEGFQKGIRAARHKVKHTDLRILNFDWHANVKGLGEEGAIEGLWSILQNVFHDQSLSAGALDLGAPEDGSRTVRFRVDVTQRQNQVLRYNCADSLDRTNVASFFSIVPVLLEQCRTLKLDLIERKVTDDIQLPEGWERRTDQLTGKSFYIDHNSKTTTWQCPVERVNFPEDEAAISFLSQPWWTLHHTVKQVRELAMPALLSTWMELFQVMGDVNGMLYTGSRAMHSAILQQILPEAKQKQKSSTSATVNNAYLSVKRRYLNVVHDGYRQQQIEMFLGMKSYYFPSLEAFAFKSPASVHGPDPDSDVEGSELKEAVYFAKPEEDEADTVFDNELFKT